MKTIILLLLGATAGAYAQNLAWDYDSFGMTIVALPGIPIAVAAALVWRRTGSRTARPYSAPASDRP